MYRYLLTGNLFYFLSTGIKLKPKTVMSKTEEEEALLRERNIQLHEWSSKFRVCVFRCVFLCLGSAWGFSCADIFLALSTAYRLVQMKCIVKFEEKLTCGEFISHAIPKR